MLDKIYMKSENEAIIYFTHRDPVNVYSDCGNVVELLAILVGPSPKESRLMDTYNGEERRSTLRPWTPSMDEDTEIINIEDLEEAV